MTILIRQFTDPICTWCWGSEPIIRKLEYKIDRVEIGFIMGGLVEDIRSFGSPRASLEALNSTIHSHWLEAEKKHGMPVRTQPLTLFSEGYLSSFPQNIAYKASQGQDDLLAKKLLRRIREATFVEGLKTNDVNVLIYLAEEVGLDAEEFSLAMLGGAAEIEFKKDRDLTRAYGVSGFPSFSIRLGEKEVLLKGFQTYETFIKVIEENFGLKIKERDLEKRPEEVLKFIELYDSASPYEISYVFDLAEEEYEEISKDLLAKGKVEKKGPLIKRRSSKHPILDPSILNQDLSKIKNKMRW